MTRVRARRTTTPQAWFGGLALLFVACTPGMLQRAEPPAVRVSRWWFAGIDSLAASLQLLALSADTASRDSLQRGFASSRVAFKRIEFLSAYFEPTTTKALNGPALPRVEDEEGPEAVFPPEGFQVVEELLWSEVDALTRNAVRNEVTSMLELVTRLRTAAGAVQLTDERVWDAARLEIARIAALGITGFDSPVALRSLPEAEAAVEGVRDALRQYDLPDELETRLSETRVVLVQAPNFEAFDRLEFIAMTLHPLAHALKRSREALGIGLPVEQRAFRMEAASLFDIDAFDPLGFAPPGTSQPTPELLALGGSLFRDPRLSGDSSRSCASCHVPSRAFSEPRSRSLTRKGAPALRNTPTLLNAGLQLGSFHDLRTTWLEDQVTDVIGNPDEMHGSVDRAAATLARDPTMRRRFGDAFPGSEPAVSGLNLRLAVAAYVRSLSTLDTRVDRAMRGSGGTLTVEERRGLNLFLGKARCGTCHFVPLFNGTVPPMYQESEVEVLGVPAAATWPGARVDPDEGRFRVTRAAPHRYAFRTPTVRHVADTGPWMHNGVYRTLEDVVEFYDRGGGAGIGIDLPNQTLPQDPLRLTRDEKQALVAFMRALGPRE